MLWPYSTQRDEQYQEDISIEKCTLPAKKKKQTKEEAKEGEGQHSDSYLSQDELCNLLDAISLGTQQFI